MKYTERTANDDDYQFLYELKKASEYDAVSRVFGWDELLQQRLHKNEWNEARPTVIEVEGKRVGSYLLEPRLDYYYFGRFFILPRFQGAGIGTAVLKRCIEKVGNKPIQLCHLQGNKVHYLYKRHAFTVTEQDEKFIHMKRASINGIK
ncbi:GNAT family N-acetyltransferase [Aliivibrio kagoshimensis]|uniref:GNAT family N-acetyltransferase n=1 Tax=Aliivibrio kagoshimensis TaxID=2910230 RepID=UPI003D0FEEDE